MALSVSKIKFDPETAKMKLLDEDENVIEEVPTDSVILDDTNLWFSEEESEIKFSRPTTCKIIMTPVGPVISCR